MSYFLYIERVPTKEECKQMHDFIDGGKFEMLKHFLEKCYNKHTLCEINFGWKVMFRLGSGLFEPTRQSIIDFCKKNHYIVTGAEKQMTIDEAFEFIDEHNNNPKNKHTYKSYFDEHPEMSYSFHLGNIKNDKWKEKGYNVEYNAFENDGLYFYCD